MVGRLIFLDLKKVKTLPRYRFGNNNKKKTVFMYLFIVTPYELSEQQSPPVINDDLMDCLLLHLICSL